MSYVIQLIFEPSKSLKMQIESSTLYTLIQWPEIQDLMDEPWFQEETSLADCDKFGDSAYFVPLTRWTEYALKTIEQVKNLYPEFTNNDNL